MLNELNLPEIPGNMRWVFEMYELNYALPVLSLQALKKKRFRGEKWVDVDCVAPGKAFPEESTEQAIIKSAQMIVVRNGLDKNFFKYFGTKP